MATPCISSPKVVRHQHLQQKTESRLKNCSARHIECENPMKCRFAYASWCPVCEEQGWSKNVFDGSRRRSKSEGMDTERSEDYYVKATKHHSDARFNKDRYYRRRENKFVDNYESVMSMDQVNLDKQLPETCHSTQEHQVDNLVKHVRRPCENHIEPNCVSNSGWNSDRKYVCKGNEVMPLHDRYYYEVEMLRSKLNRLREYPVDGKRVSELQRNLPYLTELGFKRPRDKSPSTHRQQAARKVRNFNYCLLFYILVCQFECWVYLVK